MRPTTFADVRGDIRRVARAVDADVAADREIEALHRRLSAVESRHVGCRQPTVVMLEWIDPPFSAGHWNPELIRRAGGRPMLSGDGEVSRTLDWNDVRVADPEVLILACCGQEVPRILADAENLRRQPGWNDLRAVRSGRVLAIDGSAYFNRPGPRLIDTVEIAAAALHPDRHPTPKVGAAVAVPR